MSGFGIPVEPARHARGVSIDPALGAAVAAVYPIAPIRGCAWIERVASRTARIETAGRVCWLKLDGYGRGIDELEAEAEVAAALAGRGLSVAAPVARRDGRYAGAIALPGGPRLALLFDEAPGDKVAAPSAGQAEALGVLLARVHAATDIPAAAASRGYWGGPATARWSFPGGRQRPLYIQGQLHGASMPTVTRAMASPRTPPGGSGSQMSCKPRFTRSAHHGRSVQHRSGSDGAVVTDHKAFEPLRCELSRQSAWLSAMIAFL
jgi:hypothetical protein